MYGIPYPAGLDRVLHSRPQKLPQLLTNHSSNCRKRSLLCETEMEKARFRACNSCGRDYDCGPGFQKISPPGPLVSQERVNEARFFDFNATDIDDSAIRFVVRRATFCTVHHRWRYRRDHL